MTGKFTDTTQNGKWHKKISGGGNNRLKDNSNNASIWEQGNGRVNPFPKSVLALCQITRIKNYKIR